MKTVITRYRNGEIIVGIAETGSPDLKQKTRAYPNKKGKTETPLTMKRVFKHTDEAAEYQNYLFGLIRQEQQQRKRL